MEKSGKDLRYFDEEGWNALLTQRLEQFKDDKQRRDDAKKVLEREERPKFNFLPRPCLSPRLKECLRPEGA